MCNVRCADSSFCPPSSRGVPFCLSLNLFPLETLFHLFNDKEKTGRLLTRCLFFDPKAVQRPHFFVFCSLSATESQR
ncbi:DNA polymerase iota [Histoplasma capsulatum var. duboisii H88]|uniref:DNA polymerase iota n=1 Tax=Ajellomyces capsulatus (strain H88) TaxID=544711 RepID=A0A8A1LCB4_AJEC8|nr:DNA polymerase iota [Histoplasma capsulatum var. duboisii H88]